MLALKGLARLAPVQAAAARSICASIFSSALKYVEEDKI